MTISLVVVKLDFHTNVSMFWQNDEGVSNMAGFQ